MAQITHQRRAAAVRAVEREAADMALFPELRKWNTVEERIAWGDALKAESHAKYEQNIIDWMNKAIVSFYALDDADADRFAEAFNLRSQWMKEKLYDGVYLCDEIHQFNTGAK